MTVSSASSTTASRVRAKFALAALKLKTFILEYLPTYDIAYVRGKALVLHRLCSDLGDLAASPGGIGRRALECLA